jgi:4-amino-4-deoxy-L-arabinose transferase-like glycosyltransferase
MGGGTGRQRMLITGAALLGLLAAVGLASRVHTPTGGGGGARGLDTDILLEYALVLVAAEAIVVVPAAIYAFVVGRKEKSLVLPRRRNWMVALFLTMSGLAVVSIVLLSTGYFKPHHGNPHGSPLNPLINLAGKGRAPRAIRFDWMPVIVVGSLTAIGVAAAAFVLVRRREPARPRRAAEALLLALEQTLEDLRAEPDPRRAVIAAYAQMEHALARAGLPREPSEAPREYLYRVLPGVGAGAASVERLTALFERAKFSPHAIDSAMKEEAIAALESLRDELRGMS